MKTIAIALWFALAIAACGDDAAPPGPDAGAVTVSHGGNPPPSECAPGWSPAPSGDGCVQIDAGP